MRNKSRFNRKDFPLKMPKIRSDKRNVVKGDVKCKFCEKIMVKKDRRYHLLMCKKVPQEILDQLLQNTLGR